MPKPLDKSRLGKFEPTAHQPDPTPDPKPWPSREPQSDLEKKNEPLSMRGPKSVIDRFKKMAKDDRYAQWEFLEILMDRFEQTGGFNPDK